MARHGWAVVPAFVLLGCSAAPVGSALRVTVELEPGLASRCAKVVARGSMERESGPVLLAGRTRFVVAVTQAGEQSEAELQAVGFSDDDCTVPTAPAERSELVTAAFAPGVGEVTLRLATAPASDGGVDRDGDGFPAGVDCNDDDPDLKPGAPELCFDGVDNDCDALIDCQDTGPCAGMTCSATGLCEGTVCRAPSEAGLCADGVDNDGDSFADCADLADCPQGSPCSDTNACTLGDTCGAPGQGCVKASDLVCDSPPAAQCFAQVGACLPDAGGACAYEVTSGSCSDGLACTLGDTCLGDGGCAGTQQTCATPPAGGCFEPVGRCEERLDGGCLYPPVTAGTGSCSDGDNCTTSDRCDGDGGCRGALVTCTPPDECRQWAQTCQPDGACDFTVRAGQPCADGGWSCNSAGTCVAVPVFTFTPSNFLEAQLPAMSPPVVVGCDVNLNTLQADGGVGWTTCPTGPAQPNHAVISVGGNETLLLFVEALTVNAGFRLRAGGPRPVIFAVKNDVTVNGTLDVGSTSTLRGAGSDLACGAGTGENGSASGTPETGGGGGGGAFGTDGADGADGANGGAKGAKGTQNGGASLVPLRGGCRGGHGGRVDTTSRAGAGGRGGGALQVTAGGTLTVTNGATITARGAGGRGGTFDQRIAGGGGGSGGAVLLEAAAISVASMGAVTANGGAGGEGSGYGGASWSGVDGNDGEDRATARATCPVGAACGGNGGLGGALAGAPTGGAGPSCGTNIPGGGGGGSAGRVHFRATSCTVNGGAILSPARTGTGTSCQ